MDECHFTTISTLGRIKVDASSFPFTSFRRTKTTEGVHRVLRIPAKVSSQCAEMRGSLMSLVDYQKKGK